MIVFKGREVPEDRPNYPCAAFRKVVEVTWRSIEWVHQYKFKGVWYSSHTDTKGVSLRLSLAVDSVHAYYDGPHCSYGFGPIVIHWDSWNCKKCNGEGAGND